MAVVYYASITPRVEMKICLCDLYEVIDFAPLATCFWCPVHRRARALVLARCESHTPGCVSVATRTDVELARNGRTVGNAQQTRTIPIAVGRLCGRVADSAVIGIADFLARCGEAECNRNIGLGHDWIGERVDIRTHR